MSTNLFIGSLPYKTTSEELETLFSQAGAVKSAKVIMDKVTNRSRGFGFVEMETEEGAQKAIQMFNEYELNGRKIFVNEARPKDQAA